MLEEVQTPPTRRQPEIRLESGADGKRHVKISGHGIMKVAQIEVTCSGQRRTIALSTFTEGERNAATYEIPGEVVSAVLKAPLCFLVIAGGYVPISRDLAQDVWREGGAPAR
jgi:hypothetical protein